MRQRGRLKRRGQGARAFAALRDRGRRGSVQAVCGLVLLTQRSALRQLGGRIP